MTSTTQVWARRLAACGLLFASLLVVFTSLVASGAAQSAPRAPVLSDEAFVFHPSLNDFDVAATLRSLNSGLLGYEEEVGGQSVSAARLISDVANQYSISPKVLLALLEWRGGLVTAPAAEQNAVAHVFGYPDAGLAAQLDGAARALVDAFYAHRADPGRAPQIPNAATAALAALPAAARAASEADAAEFASVYARLFGDPLHGQLVLAAPPGPMPGARLPWTAGATWNYNSGPHNNSGGAVGCGWGAATGCPPPWSAIDVAPMRPVKCEGSDEGEKYTAEWAVAARGGTLRHGSVGDGTVIIDHGDGWSTYYTHLAPTNKTAPGPIGEGDPVGYPSCQGRTNGVHLHFAVNYQGAFVNIDGTNLGGWTVAQTTHYNGAMSCPDGRKQTASGSRLATSKIEDNCRASTAAQLSVVLILDSSGSMSGNDPRRLRVEAARAFIDAAQLGDEIGVVDFESGSRLLAPMTVIRSETDRNTLKTAVNSVRAGGSTNINAGLNTGFAALTAASGTASGRAAILLTDGGHNVGAYNDQSHLQYAAKDWPIYTVGFGQSDQNLLQRIATATQGQCVNSCQPLADAGLLGQIYQDMRARLTNSTTVANAQFPLQQGQQRVLNANVMANQFVAQFYIGWQGSEMDLTLLGPSGRVIAPDQLGPDVTHAKGATYELYTLRFPEPGLWEMSVTGVEVPPGGELVTVYASTQGMSYLFDPLSIGHPAVRPTATPVPPTLTPPPEPSPAPTATATGQPTATPVPGAGWQPAGPGAASGGGISNSSGAASAPAIAVDGGGVVYVAWSDTAGGDAEIYLRRWDGASWTELGGSATGGGVSNNGTPSLSPSLAIGPDGRPWVAWHDGTSNSEVYVRRWDGASWVEVGPASATGGGISNTALPAEWVDLSVAGDGSAYATWVQHTASRAEVYVRRWNGAAWVGLGGSATGGGVSNTPGRSGRPALALDLAGQPWVAWAEEHGNGQDLYLRRWDGTTWVPVGSSTTGGGISQTPGQTQYATIVISPSGTPLVAWYDLTPGQREIYAAQWNGSVWTAAGAGSNTGGGISNTSQDSREPNLAVGPAGTPFVVWQELVGGDYEIYVRKLSAGAWTEVGAGAATGGGISDNAGRSAFPAAAVAPNARLYTAWEDDSSGSSEIYVMFNAAP